MSSTTAIEWTNRSYNPWIGCTKVSTGCDHCYAETLALQKGFVSEWGIAGVRHFTKTASEVIEWNQEAITNKTRYTVFCASLGDVFEQNLQLVEARKDLWRLVKQTPFLDWMILTKRPQNIAAMLPKDWGAGYAHVSLMVSAEDQKCFDKRVPVLQGVKCKRRALSVEPLLGPIVISKGGLKGIDLVIVGGESGDGSRPMNPQWVRDIRDACAREGVDFFFKQWGNWGPDVALAEKDLGNAAVFIGDGEEATFLEKLPADERQAFAAQPNAQVVYLAKSKKSTGKELDGAIHSAHPYMQQPGAVAPMSGKLTAAEGKELVKLEAIVEVAMEHFWKAGQALRQIRDKGLYRETHSSFESYCLEKWNMSRPEAYRQIGAASVVDDLEIKEGEPAPTTASQTRPLMKLKNASLRREAWSLACVTGVKVTAEVVESAVATVINKTTAPAAPLAAPSETATTAKEEAPTPSIRKQILEIIADIRLALGPTGSKSIERKLKQLRELVDEIKG